jgi:hypothetical protein
MLRFPDFMTTAQDDGKGKGKAVPLQAWSGPEVSRMLRFPDFIMIFINCSWVITRWQWLFYMYTNTGEKKVTRKFKSGGLHERHVVA